MQNILDNLNNSVSAYFPGIVGALVLLVVAWLVVVRARAVTILDARALRAYAESSPKHVPASARN